MDNLKNALYAGLGLAKQTEDQLKEKFDFLVAKGKRMDEEGKHLVSDLFKTLDEVKKKHNEKISGTLNDNIEKIEEFLQNLKK